MSNLIELKEVVYDKQARDGTYCKLPYPNHPKGCPNYPQCISKYPDFEKLRSGYTWFAVIEEFNLKAHAERMKEKHPDWSAQQCRCLLYWQNGVRRKLRAKAYSHVNRLNGDIVLEIPEACGVNVFVTMANVVVIIQRNPDVVRKVMLIGKFNPQLAEEIKK